MTRKIELKTEFVVPDDMDEDNVRHVLNQFFGDLIRTDRFVDAKIVVDAEMDESDVQRMLTMLSNPDGESIDQLERFVDEHTDE